MTKQEFLSQLRNALGSRVDSYIVNENVSYYEEYIATQVRAGKSEETVIEELGDPRLLARSIADANKRAGASEVEGEDESRDNEEHPMYRTYNLPGWLIVVGIFLIVLLVLGTVFSVLRVLMPFIIPIAIVVFFLRFLQRK